jgi:hypothetical protein
MAGLLGSGARVRVAAWGCAGCRYCGVTALATLSQAVEAVHARSALARCLVPGRSCSPASNAGSLAPSVSWSAYRAKVPGQDVLRTAIRGRGHVLRSRPRAAALRRARLPRRREGLFFAWRERREELFLSCKRVSSFITDATDALQRPLPHRELHEAGGAAGGQASDDIPSPSLPNYSPTPGPPHPVGSSPPPPRARRVGAPPPAPPAPCGRRP